jgi:GNAT superfamily N-acetyltransferase
MPAQATTLPDLEFHALTADRWVDLVKLFGPNGACAGCWCMWWRQTQSEFNRLKGPANKKALRRLVQSGRAPGILAYSKGEPVGWCAVEPREVYERFARSRILKPVDDRPVWSVTCFFVSRDFRRKGLSSLLLRAAVDHAARNGASIVEGYPTDPAKDDVPAPFVWTGLSGAFLKAGFKEVARRSKGRPIMRYEIRERAPHPMTRTGS